MEDKLSDKLKRKACRDAQKRLKPGECLKYVRMVLDETILTNSYGADLISALKDESIPHVIRKLECANCIVWERNAGQRLLELKQPTTSGLSEEWQMEQLVLCLLTSEQLQDHIYNETLNELCACLGLRFKDKCLTLIIVSNHELHQNDRMAKNLIEMQVEHKICYQTQTLQELAVQLRRFNKAVAEQPFKEQRAESLGVFKKYLANDKKQCVRVVGADGLHRLWQQHLNRLPGVTLHMSETIMSAYSCPKKLLASYEQEPWNGAQCLAELRVMRGNGASETARRLGDVLSAKFHKLYTSVDPDEII